MPGLGYSTISDVQRHFACLFGPYSTATRFNLGSGYHTTAYDFRTGLNRDASMAFRSPGLPATVEGNEGFRSTSVPRPIWPPTVYPPPAGLKHRHDDGCLARGVLRMARWIVRAAAWAQSAAAGTAQISATRRAVIMTIKVTIGGVETLRLADIAPAIERTVLLRMSQVAYDAMQTGAARHTKTGVLFQSIYNRSAGPEAARGQP